VFELGLAINLFPHELATATGNSFAFFLQGNPLPETGSNGTYDRYESVRTSSGWTLGRRLSPSGAEAVFPNNGGISPDHQYYFVNVNEVEPGSLGEDGPASYIGNPDGSYELIGIGSLGVEPRAEGRLITSGATHVIFSTGGPDCGGFGGGLCEVKQLEEEAAPTGTPAVYDRSADGATHVVSLLPGNITPADGESAEYQGASRDGSSVSFKIGETLYVRVDNVKTLEVETGETTFAGFSNDGGKLFYLLGGNLYWFDTDTGENHTITATGDVEIVNVSQDGSHVYFISFSQQPGTSGLPGEPNLYGWDRAAGDFSYIGTVSLADLSGKPALNNWTSRVVVPRIGEEDGPSANSSRTTPDGSVLVFQSHAKLTDYENGGFSEIYRYDDRDGSLICVSCNPTGLSPSRDARLTAVEVEQVSTRAVIHNLSDDGTLVFFESAEQLSDRDVDTVNDIYEWNSRSAASTGLQLISSGHNPAYSPAPPQTNILGAITPSGSDVFFRSASGLTATVVPGIPAIYDARVGGGFLEPFDAPCQGDACQNAPSVSQVLGKPASSVFLGKGNQRPRCKKGTRKSIAKKRTCRKRHKKRAHGHIKGGAR